jgi:hypothetical protein
LRVYFPADSGRPVTEPLKPVSHPSTKSTRPSERAEQTTASDDGPAVGVVLSTFNAPDRLRRCLLGYACQQRPADEIIVADDGSGEETAAIIDRFRDDYCLPLVHVWQPNTGFGKTRILNDALHVARSPYLVFSDGDCIPRADFLEVHAKLRRPGYFLSGGCLRLTRQTTDQVDDSTIIGGCVFDSRWLAAHGTPLGFQRTRLLRRRRLARCLDLLTSTRPSWNGHNASGWRADLVRVNGFDERMGYGGEDRELGERMIRFGIRSLQIRYRAACMHLDHDRPYVCKERLQRNAELRRANQRSGALVTEHGLYSHNELREVCVVSSTAIERQRRAA